MHDNDHYSEYTSNLLYRAHINILRQTFQGLVKSLAVPIMAHGGVEMISEAVVRVLRNLVHLKGSENFSVDEISFVSTKESHVETLEKYIDEHLYFSL